MDVNELQSRLEALLATAGCSRFTVHDLHRETRQCRDDIYADDLAQGQSPADPFFNFVVVEGVAVFTFFESDFSVYVVKCNEIELINQTGALALVNTDACKALLARSYGKTEPDLVVPRALAEYWLSS